LKTRELAYAAGIVDGEGCVTLRTRRPWGNEVSRICVPTLMVCNTDPRLTDWLRARFGGSVCCSLRPGSHQKDVYRWSVVNRQCRAALLLLLPFLILKKAQAEVLLASSRYLMDHKTYKGHSLPPELIVKRAAAIQEIRLLNRRGPPPAVTSQS